MTRNLKALGLALLAAFALSAVAASAASADDVFTSNSPTGSTDLTGSSVEPTLSTPAFTVECAAGTYAGTAPSNSETELTVHPTYHGFEDEEGDCIIPELSGETVKVDTHGCDYILTGKTDVTNDATVFIECTNEGAIELTTTELGITLDIPEQGPLTGVRYEEKGETITVEATVGEIKYECTGALCFLLENEGSGEDGFYSDDVLTSGYEDIDAFHMDEETHTWTGEHGSKIDLGLHEE